MTANHSPQREGGRRGAVEEAQSRQRDAKLGKAIGVGVSVLLAIPVIGLPIAFLVQFLRWLLRHEVLSIVPAVVFLVGVMAVIAALHFLQYGKEGYGLGGTLSSVASFVGVALILGGALIGRVSQEWLLGTNLMGLGMVAATIGVAGLAIVSLAEVLPWWGRVALVAGNPFLFLYWISPLGPHLGGTGVVVVPWVVVGFAVVFRAISRRTERPARVS